MDQREGGRERERERKGVREGGREREREKTGGMKRERERDRQREREGRKKSYFYLSFFRAPLKRTGSKLPLI